MHATVRHSRTSGDQVKIPKVHEQTRAENNLKKKRQRLHEKKTKNEKKTSSLDWPVKVTTNAGGKKKQDCRATKKKQKKTDTTKYDVTKQEENKNRIRNKLANTKW